MASFYDYQQYGISTYSNALLRNYSKLGLNEIEFIIVLELESFSQEKNLFPSNDQIASVTGLRSVEVAAYIQELIDKKIIELNQTTDADGKINNFYSLKPLYDLLDKFVEEKTNLNTYSFSKQQNSNTSSDPAQKLVRQFEIEFGRLLSPIERQEIAAWVTIDHYDPEVIELALRESVLVQVYNFKYVDRILLNWQRRGLHTPQQVKSYLQRNE